MSFPLLISLVCLALVMNTMSFMTITPVLPLLFAEWGLSETQAGLLGGVFFAGYVGAVPLLVPLTDRIPPKRVYLFSGVICAAACFGFAYLADGLWSGVLFRLLSGVGVAGTYMPALKALADSLEEPQRTRAATYYTSVYAIGTALSVLSAGLAAEWFGWRWSFALAGFGTLGGLVLGWMVLPAGRVAPPGASHAANFRRVFANRSAMLNIASYICHLWEVFAFRVWIVTFLVFAETFHGASFVVSATVLATLTALIGVPASFACGEIAVRQGRERVIRTAMIVSCLAGCALAAATAAPLWLIAVLALLYGMTGYADTGTLNAATVAVAEPEVRGATMAVHTAMGFSGGILGSLAVGAALGGAGGKESPAAWSVALLVMAGGSAAGYAVRRVARRGKGSQA